MDGAAPRWYARMRLVPPGDGVLVARDRRGGSGEKEYARVAGPGEILALARGRGAAFYEHADDAEPCTAYFDIDKRGAHDARAVLEANVAWIVELLAEHGHAVEARDLRVLECCREHKVSFHVLVRSVVLDGVEGRKGLQRAIKAKLRARESDVDPAPYGRNALFRTVHSSKLGTGVPLKPYYGPSGLAGPDGPNAASGAVPELEYMIRDVDPEARALVVDAPEREVARQAYAPPCVSGVVGEHAEHVVAAVRASGDAESEYRPAYGQGGRYYFQTRGRRVCLASGATHTSNNFLVVVASDGAIVYQCLSARCSRETRTIGRLPTLSGAEWERETDVERYSEPRTRPYAPREGVTLVRAAMGTGKTYRLREYVGAGVARVLVVSFRVALCRYLHEYLGGGFALYSDVDEPAACARLIVTVNSLYKLRGASYDVLVLDEAESIMEQFEAVHPSNQRLGWLVFDMLVRSTPRVLCLDAELGPRTVHVMRAVRPGRPALVVNEYPCSEKREVVVEKRDRFLTSLHEALAAGSRVAFASTSAAQLVAVHAVLARMLPSKRIYLIHAGTPEAEKVLFARKCNRFLDQYDALFYSPTIQAGNSIDVPFDAMFVHATPGGPSPEGVHQMIGRVRSLRTGRVTVTFDVTPTAEAREYTYDEMARHLTRPLAEHASVRDLATRFTADWTLELERSAMFVLTVWNKVYCVNGQNNFAPRFLRLCESKGYEVRSVVEDGDVALGAAVAAEARARCAETREEHLAAVVAARRLDAAGYARMREDLRIPSAERDVALAVERYEFCQCYGVNEDALTVEMLRRYARPARRGAYHRLCLMLPPDGARDGASVARRIDDVLRAEGSLLEMSGPDHVFAAVHLPRTSGVRLRLAHQLFVELGFESALDTGRVAAETMDARAARMRALLAEHRDSIDTAFLTPCAARRREAPGQVWATADVVRYVNQCVRELLGVYVRRSPRGWYQLVGSGTWDFGQRPPRPRVPLRSADLTDWTVFG